MTIHSSILVWRVPWTEEPGGYSPWGRKESDRTHTHVALLHCCQQVNKIPLQSNLIPPTADSAPSLEFWSKERLFLRPSVTYSFPSGSRYSLSNTFGEGRRHERGRCSQQHLPLFLLFLCPHLYLKITCYLLCGLWDLSSPTRDPKMGAQNLNHQTTREVPHLVFKLCLTKPKGDY